MRLVKILLAGLFLSAPALGRECGQAIYSRHQQLRSVDLAPQPAGPAYYAVSPPFVISFSPDVVFKVLEKRAQEIRFTEARELLRLLRETRPSNGNVDLYQFAIDRRADYLETNILIAQLLEDGQATLRNMLYDGTAPSQAIKSIVEVIVHNKSAPVSAREFCAPTGELLLAIVDEIKD